MAERLTVEQRQEFLAEVRIGVLTVASEQPDRAPLAVPLWYSYTPDLGVTVVSSRETRKARAIEAAGRFSLAVQDEALPYRYVTVEGPLVEVRRCELERDLVPMAVRYLGEAAGRAYGQAWLEWGGAETDMAYVMRPIHWNTADFAKDMAGFH
jgi:nitroimidazol reductase NimA-like FMN-containing flavoprotein (pyridoxamine 5'-phosphate oxidase superfamily)